MTGKIFNAAHGNSSIQDYHQMENEQTPGVWPQRMFLAKISIFDDPRYKFQRSLCDFKNSELPQCNVGLQISCLLSSRRFSFAEQFHIKWRQRGISCQQTMSPFVARIAFDLQMDNGTCFISHMTAELTVRYFV